jgi:hypothetical protein
MTAQRIMLLTFANGATVQTSVFIGSGIVAIDSDGDLIASDYDMMYPLTPCCHASGKGAEVSTGVVCRSCMDEVDGKFGAVYSERDIAYGVRKRGHVV